MTILRKIFDERFFEHRRRSTSIAGVAGGVLALCLFEYRYVVNHVLNWDLLAVGLTFVLIKLGMMTWYYLAD